jgi:nucleotide-binding universal stress UspA family protein
MIGPHEYVGRRAEMSIFPTKILLATDGSEEAQLALSTAVDLATSTNSELHVVTVGPWTPTLPMPCTKPASVGKPMKKQAKRSARKLGKYSIKG